MRVRAAAVLTVLLLAPRLASAVPYFAVLHNTQCSHCHVSPTGAGMRNDHGRLLFSDYSLEATSDLFDDDFRGRVNKFIAIGGDLRMRHLSTIEPPRTNAFSVTEGTLYLAIDPISHFTIYADTDLANVVNREVFGLIHHLPAGLWFKFGRLNLPYGLRLPDDTSFIRGDLGFSFAAQDIGVEMGLEPGPVTLAVGFTNGVGGGNNDTNNAKAVSWFSEWRLTKWLRVGGSFHFNSAAALRTITGGGHAGLHIGKVALLGEFDLQQIHDQTTGAERTVLAGFGEVDFEVIRGLDLKGIYEGTDDRLAGSGLHHRISGGIEIFPIPYLEVDLLYRNRIGTGALGDDQILLVFHGYY